MGCPKHFSVSGGMGAALLSNLPKAKKIVEQIRTRTNVPVTCKIRVHEDTARTIDFCKAMEESGVHAIAVHGRTVNERPQHRNRIDAIREIARSISIPVIAKYCLAVYRSNKHKCPYNASVLSIFSGGSNGMETHEDILHFMKDTECKSVMLARVAQYNASIFRKEGKLPLDEVIESYLKYAVDYDNCFPNTKYCVQSMLRDLQDTPKGKLFLETQNLEQLW